MFSLHYWFLPGLGIEKAVRDLQRCSVSFGRYRTLLNEEFEESYKKLKQVSILSENNGSFLCYVPSWYTMPISAWLNTIWSKVRYLSTLSKNDVISSVRKL